MTIAEPYAFKRGFDFNLVLTLPSYVISGHFSTYTGTAQIRKYQDDSDNALIADLDFEWIIPEEALSISLKKSGTDEWPLGLAELDILLTSPDDEKVGTRTILIKIERSITRGM